MDRIDFLIVGAGFAGVTCARALADAGRRVHVIEKRAHIGGNAFDVVDSHGVLIHPYGPHLFHTNSTRVFTFLSRFTDWRFYEHRVLAFVEGRLLPLPINRTTINRLYGFDLDEEGVRAYLASVREIRTEVRTSEDVVLQAVGSDLCDKFFRGYTRKQWGLDLSDLSPAVAARIPTRCDDDDRYFTDAYQFMPASGYTAMFSRMLDHPAITVETGVDFEDVRKDAAGTHIIYTGPIDAYFGHCYGRLPYRSLRFEHEHLPHTSWFQPVGTVNYPNDHEFTRITEFKRLTGEHHPGTSIMREFPQTQGEPFYPIPRAENHDHYRRYEALARGKEGVTFVGRLAQYRYYNMDQAVEAALDVIPALIGDRA